MKISIQAIYNCIFSSLFNEKKGKKLHYKHDLEKYPDDWAFKWRLIQIQHYYSQHCPNSTKIYAHILSFHILVHGCNNVKTTIKTYKFVYCVHIFILNFYFEFYLLYLRYEKSIFILHAVQSPSQNHIFSITPQFYKTKYYQI